MKIAYFGLNALSSCLDLLLHHKDIEIVVIYTGEESEHSDQIMQLAGSCDITLKTNKPTINELEHWIEKGVDCFISAEYPYKIAIPNCLKYSFNIHPTLLPAGRGQTPLPHLILKKSQYAGITLHKMTNKFDQGDIIISKAITLSENETFDSLHAKVFLDAPMLLKELLDDFSKHYLNARSQSKVSNWPTITEEQQTINWSMNTQEIKLITQAFGSLGVKFMLNDLNYYLTDSKCVIYSHAYQAGDVISFDSFKLIIATVDGFVIILRECLFEF